MFASRKSRILLVTALLVCIAAAAVAFHFLRRSSPLPLPAAGAPPAILSALPSDAPVLCYIDAAALRKLQSPLAAILGLAGPGPRADRDYARFVRGTGFDYTRDLDQVAIAFWPRGIPAGAPGARNAFAENRALAIADGRFDPRKIAAYALKTGKLLPRGAQSVYEVPGDPPAAFEFLSDSRIAISSGPRPADLLPLAPAPADAPASHDAPALQARLARVGAAPVFALAQADRLPASFYDALGDSSQLARLARSVRNLSFAIQTTATRIDAVLDAQSDSDKDAFELSSMAGFSRLFASAAIADARRRGQLSAGEAQLLDALVKQVRVTRDGRWVRLGISLSPQPSPGGSTAPPARPRPAPRAR